MQAQLLILGQRAAKPFAVLAMGVFGITHDRMTGAEAVNPDLVCPARLGHGLDQSGVSEALDNPVPGA